MNVRLLASVPLLAIAVLSFGEALHIRAKAMIAQRLIERAWQQTLSGTAQSRPWHWADTWPVARLKSDRLRRDLFVLAGAGGGSLAFGPGHYSNTPLPGLGGTSVVAGHRDTHFSFLRDIEAGEALRVQDTSGQWSTYRVRDRLIVDTRESDVWATAPARDELHLITCYPFDTMAPGGPLRLIVVAEKTASRLQGV